MVKGKSWYKALLLQNLLGRGFTEQQIEENGYKSTPVFGYKKLTRKLLEAGCTVKGVPGFSRRSCRTGHGQGLP